MKDNINAYTQTDILGKSQVELVIKVYDGAIDAYKAARQAYEKEDNNAGFEKLQKAATVNNYLAGTSRSPKRRERTSPAANLPTLRQVPSG